MKALVIAAALVAIAGQARADCATDRAEVEALLTRYVETAVNAHRLDRYREFYHDPLVFNGVEMSLADFLKTVIAPNYDLQPDITWKVDDHMIDCDKLGVRYRVGGTLAKPYRDLQPTGRPFSIVEIAFYHVRDGKFDAVWDVFDSEAFADQTRGGPP